MHTEIDDVTADELQGVPLTSLRPVSRKSALMAYNFLMSGMVARLYLYLFGEIERDAIGQIVEKIMERRTVFDKILDEKKPPLRAIYDHLIEIGLLEDQKLCEEAMLFIDQPDILQHRIAEHPDNLSDEQISALHVERTIQLNATLSVGQTESFTHSYDPNILKGN